MQHATWIELLRMIPPEQHDSMVVVTTVGTEITFQAVLRVEPEYVVIRGRLSGTTDTGRVFFLPYDQINYLAFFREVPESQIRDLYRESPQAASDAAGGETAAEEAPPTEATLPGGAPTPTAQPKTPAPDVGRAPLRSPLLGKTRLIERLRARAQPGTTPRPPDK
jgi:hypothetical protein